MLLSIGMIVKNEEKWLDRCLSAIKPILDNVDSELIITDTGSTDRTVEIAEKFTDKILHFDWIKDFSAARNTAFAVASGEWFMFLDADEIFESCDGIIDFFNSGEYQKYKSASFVIRNLYSGDDYIDFYPRRLARRYPDTRFVGIIHEYLSPIYMPSKNLYDVALHYGYVYTTFEETQAKFRRNSELMLKTLETEEDPHPKIYSQLFDGYGSVYEFESAMKYLEIGIEKCRLKNDSYIVILFFQKAEHYYRNSEYEKTLDVCADYFSEKERMKLPALTTDGDIYAYAADSLFALGRCGEAIEYYKKYFDTYREIKNGRLCTEDMHQKTIEMCSDRVLPGLFNNFLGCCINTGKFNTADMYILSYPINYSEISNKALVTLCARMTMILGQFEYKNVGKYLSILDEKGKSLFQDMLLVRFYASCFDEKLGDALKRSVDNSHKKYVEALLGYRCGNNDPEILYSAAEKIVNIWNHSVELMQHDCGKSFMIDVVRCAENIASIGAMYPLNNTDYPDLINAAVTLNDCIEMKKSGRIKECISGLKNVVRIYEPAASLISEYSKCIIKELEEKSKMSEMDRLALAVKNNIKAMIAAGNSADAKKMLDEYRNINPNDVEIIELESALHGK